MAARTPGLIALIVVVIVGAGVGRGMPASGQAPPLTPAVAPRAPQRIVSLVPSLTETLFAVGAGAQVVGVSTFDAFPAAVNALPRVGGLLDPDVERIVSLRPDLVVTYGTQSSLEAQLARAGIRTFSYRHGGIAAVVDAVRQLSKAVGHSAEGERVAAEIERRVATVRSRVRGRPRPRTLLVFGRQPGTLREIYASGGSGFLHEMLDAAGAEDLFADLKRESVQPSTEMVIARMPDVILEVRADAPAGSNGVTREQQVWATLSSLPAVRSKRIYLLSGDYLVVPGPRLAEGVEVMAKTLHPDAFK